MSDESESAEESEPEAAGVQRAEYDLLAGLNYSRLKLLERSPAHFKLGRGGESKALKLGIAAHMAVLEPARFADEYEVTEVRRDARTAKWQAAESDAIRRGKTLVSRSEMSNTLAILDAVHANKRAREYLSGGKPEFTMTWKIEAGGVSFDCKGRADYVGSALVDLKSTQCSSPKSFGYSVLKFGYLMQAAFYSDGLFLATGERKPFVIVAVESAPPHIVTVFRVTPEQLERGRNQYLDLLIKLDYCQRNNWWGGYTESEEVDLELPQSSGWSEEQ